jgi:hypothetical protein
MLDIKGYFIVNKNKFIGANIQYTVLLLADRFIFMKTGGHNADVGLDKASGMWGAFGGLVGGIMGSVIDNKNQKLKSSEILNEIDKFNRMTEEQVLKADKVNYVIKKEEIFRLHIRKSIFNLVLLQPRAGVLTVTLFNQKKQNYDISVKSNFNDMSILLETVMPDKLQTF